MSRPVDLQTEDLADLPLRGSPGEDAWAGLPDTLPESAPQRGAARAADRAVMGRRAMAFAADAALVFLVVAAALLGAQARTGRGTPLSGVPWAAAFALYFSFFAIVLPLLLFGRTLGLALAGLRVREGLRGRGLSLSEAAARWVGTLATAASLGLPLLWTLRDPELPTPADRLSGRPLAGEGWPANLS
ncbi:MAG: RDD family protein [Thermoanaerobaculia bacterium]